MRRSRVRGRHIRRLLAALAVSDAAYRLFMRAPIRRSLGI
jgi:hypothetical protein